MDKRDPNLSPHPEVKKTSHGNDLPNPSPHRARDLNLIGSGQHPSEWLKSQACTSEVLAPESETNHSRDLQDAYQSTHKEIAVQADKKKGLLSAAEMEEEWRSAKAIGEDGKPVPRAFNLASECTLQHPLLLGGMQALWRHMIGETSQGIDNEKIAEAERLYKQAKRQFGRNNINTAAAMNNLANAYAEQNMFPQATDLYQRALPICERELGQKHSGTHEVRAKLRLGQKLGSYNLISFLGRGGFAYVYLGKYDQPSTQGQDHPLPTLAAVKVLQTHLIEQYNRDDFYREAGILASLQHEHIVRTYEFGTQGDAPYLIMHYAARGSLHDAHRRGTCLAPRQIVDYVNQTADALYYIHNSERRMHLDLKPDNLFLEEKSNGELKILLGDFGLVKIAHDTTSRSEEDPAGTPIYMAPEQFHGQPCRASDQYELGIIVYEWLCGQPPFQGDHIQLEYRHREVDPEPLLGRIPDLSPEMAQIVSKMEPVVFKALAKNPEDRHENIKIFAEELEKSCDNSSHNIRQNVHDMNGETSQGRDNENIVEAKRLYRQAEQQFGSDHHETAKAMTDLANLYRDQSQFTEAEPLYQRAHEIYEQRLGVDHSRTIKALNNLAIVYKGLNKLTEAELLFKRILEIYKQQWGTDHPDTARALNNLARLYRKQSRVSRGRNLVPASP